MGPKLREEVEWLSTVHPSFDAVGECKFAVEAGAVAIDCASRPIRRRTEVADMHTWAAERAVAARSLRLH